MLICIGLTEAAANRFIGNGVNSVFRLKSLSDKDLKRLIKQIQNATAGVPGVEIPFMCQQYVHAMRFWTECQAISAMPFNPEDFDIPEAEEWMQ